MSQLQHLIAEFALPVNLLTFCELFLYSDEWYEDFLLNSLHDRKIVIGAWSDCENQQSKVREVKSEHPSKVSFPGLPSHAESLKIQKLSINSTNNSLVLIETNKFHGIPMSDYFRVDTVWNVEEMIPQPLPLAPPLQPPPSVTGAGASSESSVRIRISCEVVFHQSTWLKGTIESNTKSELLSVFTLWKDLALKTISDHEQASLQLNNNQLIIDQSFSQERDVNRIESMPSSSSVTDIRFPPLFVLDDSEVNATQNIFSDTELVFYDCEEGNQPSSGGHSAAEEEMDEEYSSLLRDVKLKQEKLRGAYQSHPGQRHPFDRYLLSKRDIAVDPHRYLHGADDEDEEEEDDDDEESGGGGLNGDHTSLSLPFNRRRVLKTKNSSDSISEEKEPNGGDTSDSNSKRKKSKKKYPLPSSAMSYRPLLTPSQILEIYGSNNSSNQSASSSPTNETASHKPSSTPPDARHLAGAIAEILFVLVESIFWQVSNLSLFLSLSVLSLLSFRSIGFGSMN
jgi:hypothetical protein